MFLLSYCVRVELKEASTNKVESLRQRSYLLHTEAIYLTPEQVIGYYTGHLYKDLFRHRLYNSKNERLVNNN